VSSKARYVLFHPQRIELAVSVWGHVLAELPGWGHPCHYFDGTEDSVRWIFALDILNHCFWPDPDNKAWTISYGSVAYSGYWGLAASLKRGMELGFPITQADYLARISAADLRSIFAGEGCIPLFENRLQNLREAGCVLIDKWKGDVVHLLEEAKGSAVKVVRLIVSSFPSFRDEAQYKGERICFWKRAQLFVSDVYSAFEGKGFGNFSGIDELTAFADYKLPQVLRALGVLSYHPDLSQRIDTGKELTPCSEEEVEIRAATVLAVEEFKKTFMRAGRLLSSARIDNWLWGLGQLEPFRKKPYHRCRTIFY